MKAMRYFRENSQEIHYFINGLSPEISSKVAARNPTTLKGAIDRAKIYDEEITRTKKLKVAKPVLTVMEGTDSEVVGSISERKQPWSIR